MMRKMAMPSRFSKFRQRLFGTQQKPVELLVTLYPSLPHFGRFAHDDRLAGLRFNSAKTTLADLIAELKLMETTKASVPIFFDVKGRQLRVVEAEYKPFGNPDHVEVVLNHPIAVPLPVPVLFKAENDSALLIELADGGKRLIFAPHQPRMLVGPGESIHIRDHRLQAFGPQFTDLEKLKIENVRAAYLRKWFLSFVQSQRDVDEFRELVGRDAEVWLKIEDQPGLKYVATEFRKVPELTLVAARGDLYIEVERPHDMSAALKLIIEHDSEACVASRIMLSTCRPGPLDLDEALNAAISGDVAKCKAARARIAHAEGMVPDCADFLELAWLYDIGYRRFMLCDNLCLKESMLATAVNAFDAWRQSYPKP